MKITTLMGVLLFFTGLGGILLGTAGMLTWIRELNLGQQLFLMIGGAILCVLGYFMARGRVPIAEPKDEEPES